jgi:hypothetical protein
MPILLARGPDVIFRRRALTRKEKEFDRLRKVAGGFYWHRVVMTFIKGELLYD